MVKISHRAVAKIAPHGVSAFVSCRMEDRRRPSRTSWRSSATASENETHVENKRLLDGALRRDLQLPPRPDFLRRFVEDCEDRVVGVENRLEPHRTQSACPACAANESTYKFKPSVALKRHQWLNELDVQDDDVAMADDTEQVPAKADPAENAVARGRPPPPRVP